jgi:DNA-binding SARP family transcriptional activator
MKTEAAVGRSIPAAGPMPSGRLVSATPGAANEVAPLEIRLLGRVELSIAGQEIRLASRGAQALIALLALKPRVRSREAVATEIWPDGEGSGTSASLRQALWLVRSSFAAAAVPLDRYLTIDAEVIGLSACAPVDLDVARFEAALRGSAAGPEDALSLYHGDLVECLGLECFANEAERLSDAYEDALTLVAERRLAAGDPIGARDAAELLLARDPLREEAHATLLRVHGQVGSRAQVVRQYRRLTQLLADELGVEPLPETLAAYRVAMAETVERSRLRAAALAFATGPTGPGRRVRSGGLSPGAAHR